MGAMDRELEMREGGTCVSASAAFARRGCSSSLGITCRTALITRSRPCRTRSVPSVTLPNTLPVSGLRHSAESSRPPVPTSVSSRLSASCPAPVSVLPPPRCPSSRQQQEYRVRRRFVIRGSRHPAYSTTVQGSLHLASLDRCKINQYDRSGPITTLSSLLTDP